MLLVSLLTLDLTGDNIHLRNRKHKVPRGCRNRVLTKSSSSSAFPMILMLSKRSVSSMTSGGANRILDGYRALAGSCWRVYMRPHILTWVGFESTPMLFKMRQSCQAVLPRLLFDSSMTTAFSNPRPLTSLTRGEFNARIPRRNFSPRSSARSDKRSSIRMSSAVVATAHPKGFLWVGVKNKAWCVPMILYPPYVLPCSPGLMQSMIALSANTADTGYTGNKVSDWGETANNTQLSLTATRESFPE